MKLEAVEWVKDTLEKNGIKIKPLEQEVNDWWKFELDFSEHDRTKDDEINQYKSEVCKLENQLEEIKQTLKENHVFLLGIGKGACAVDFSEHDKPFNDKIDELIEINSGLSHENFGLQDEIQTLLRTIRIFAREESRRD